MERWSARAAAQLRAALLAGLGLLIPAPGVAQGALYRFETECVEASAFADTSFELTLSAGSGPGEVILGTISGQIRGSLTHR